VAAIPRGAFPALPSRHLGLVTADSRNLTQDILNSLADAVESHGSVDDILRIAGDFSGTQESRVRPEEQKMNGTSVLRLGVALDEAFHFYYPDNLEALEKAGFQLVNFSPLRDMNLPENLDALYIGGGYPEAHAESLSANNSMLGSVRQFAETGKPIYAECGGLMYLAAGIESLQGIRHEMVGLIPQWTRMLARRRSLGYVEIALSEDSLFGKTGDILRGHEFHYSDLVGDPAANGSWRRVYAVKRRRNNEDASEGFQMGNILASYVHAHFASRPGAVKRFAAIAAGD